VKIKLYFVGLFKNRYDPKRETMIPKIIGPSGCITAEWNKILECVPSAKSPKTTVTLDLNIVLKKI
jgi:hypothetical protein